jgi:hypothetical protein
MNNLEAVIALGNIAEVCCLIIGFGTTACIWRPMTVHYRILNFTACIWRPMTVHYRILNLSGKDP